MRMLLAGDFTLFFYEEACARALEQSGIDVVRFAWGRYFNTSLISRAQAKLMAGPIIGRLNEDLLQAARMTRPDVIFIWRGNPILPSTLEKLRSLNDVLLVSYHNDDPFGLTSTRRWWRLFHRAIPLYDLHFVYRHSNIEDFARAGAKEVHLLRSYFIPEVHRPVVLSDDDQKRFGCQVVFAGHYEPDGRVKYLEALVQAGVNLRLFGGTWNIFKDDGTFPQHLLPVVEVRGDDYVKALCGAEMALSFLSKINRDTYTRRCFEIPACGRLLLSERTDDLCSLYEEDKEAVFFSSPAELVSKVSQLSQAPERIASIAAAGRDRCMRDGHDVYSRMKEVSRILHAKRPGLS